MKPSETSSWTPDVGRSILSALLFVCAVNGQTPPSQFGGIQGVVFTAENAQERSFVPGAHVRIRCAGSEAAPVEVSTDESGGFVANGLRPCRYHVAVEFTGMEPAEVEVPVELDKFAVAEIELKPANIKQEITVSAQAEAVETAETESKAVLQQSTIEHAPNANERIESVLPLLPGVVRGPDGLINMKGARTSQSGMLLNSANVTDPVTGASGMNLPIDVVSTAQVISNPYDPGYGKAVGAAIDTRLSSFDKFHFRMQNFIPRPRKRDGSIVGIESTTPRLTITGPLIPGKVAFTQSFEYRYVRTPVTTQPHMQRDMGLESFDSYTQVDLSLTERQSASVTLAFYPQKQNYLGLNTFMPQAATPDLHQRGYFLAFAHKFVSRGGALLSSQISYKTFDANLMPRSYEQYRLGIETTSGGFFSRQDRSSDRFELQEVFSPRAINAWGQHQFKVGGDFARNSYDGRQTFSPVDVLRASGTLAERIDFSPAAAVSARQREYTAFALDKWTLHKKVTLDAGLRADRDSVSDEGHVAPRIGLAFAPFDSGRTVIRGGLGYFYDRINLNIPTFAEMPWRTVTDYRPDGSAAAAVVYRNKFGDPLQNPRSTAWNAEVEQQVRPNLILKAAATQRITVREFFLQPLEGQNTGALVLSNNGRSRYREFQLTARYQIHKHVLNASYVRSSAIGDLNDFNQFFGNTPNPIIRPNERSLQPFDAPNRFLFWGQFELPKKIIFSPVWDIHTGFPYSVVDEERNFVGERNRAGRFPRFSSTDFQATKEVRLPFRDGKYRAQIGLRVFNLFDHYNPRDVQSNLASYRYGEFLNSVDRAFRGKFVLEF